MRRHLRTVRHDANGSKRHLKILNSSSAVAAGK